MADEVITTDVETSTDPTTKTTPVDKPAEDTIDLGADDKVEDKPADDKGEDKPADEDPERAALFGEVEGDYTVEGLPEGMEVDKDALAALTPIAKQMGLSNVGVSKLAAVYADQLPKIIEGHTSQIQQQIADTRKEWEGQTLQAIGGKLELKTQTGDKIEFDGKSAKQVQQDAARAIDRLAPAGFREFLAETGLGQHPGMVALCYAAGKALAEDTDFEGDDKGGGKTTQTERFYGRK